MHLPSALATSRGARRAAAASGAALLVAAGLVTGASAASAVESTTLSFTTVADTWVNAAYPSTSYATSSRMTVDASPESQALLRFDLSTLAGKTVTGVTLRLYQGDASNSGGRVHPLASDTWSESTTWNSRPALGTDVLATFGAVSSGSWYEVPLDKTAVTAGPTSFGMTSTSGDGARWGTRESTTPPQLLVTVAADSPPLPPPSEDGVTAVAAGDVGSSEPTYYSGNHRVAVTNGGRVLALHGRHKSGVQLTWRDLAGSWQTASTGASTTGGVLTGTGSGDWPASIALATDPDGAQHAWVVVSRQSASALRPVQMRRLTDLDSPAGPRLGPLVTIDSAPRGAYKADVAFEQAADGSLRGCVLYSRRVGDTTYELTSVWFSDLTTDHPSFGDRTVLRTSSSSSQYGSLVATAGGLRAVARVGSRLTLYGHQTGAPLTSWFAGATGPSIPNGSSPAGVALSNGEVLVAVEDDVTNHVANVYRFSASGTSGASLLRAAGLAQPTIVSDGADATLVAVRSTDGALVSRTWSAGAWTTGDRLEVDPAQTGRLAWPNALRQADGQLRVLAEGPGTTTSTSSVWGYQRAL